MSYKRQRSSCEVEEQAISAFIDSCVSYTANLSVHTVEEGAAMAGAVRQAAAPPSPHTVLLMGSDAVLQDWSIVTAQFPYANEAVKEAIKHAANGTLYAATVERSVRVFVGKVPSQASRHNCPARPDAMNGIVKAALAACPADEGAAGLDVYYVGRDGYELCVVGTVARNVGRSFSAKGGNATRAYVQKGRRVRLVVHNKTAEQCAALTVTANAVQLCQRLVDAPTNLLDTTTFAEIAALWIDKLKRQGHNVSIDIVQGEQLREQGYGGLYGTGKAAEYPPHLVTLSYKPAEGIAPKDKIAFVGKGIVYDTGGLAIKPASGMCTMKHDMGGAAAIFGGFLSLVQLRAPVEVSCILCLADNAVGPRAQRNDDIIVMKSGVTVEVNNTDAEGRLVLSDGVYHASAELPYTPNIIIDMATLTGVQSLATGKYHAAIFANTAAIESRLVDAGLRSGDMCYPLIYAPELHNLVLGDSKMADFINSCVRDGSAAASAAGQFVGNNLARTYTGEWVHVDLAAPATYDEATGFGVALLVELFSGGAV